MGKGDKFDVKELFEESGTVVVDKFEPEREIEIKPSTVPVKKVEYEGLPEEDEFESAAKKLLEKMQAKDVMLVKDMAYLQLKLPLWQFIIGHLMNAIYSGTIASPQLDPSWQDSTVVEKVAICKECKQEFIPKHMDQPYCSNKCGAKGLARSRGEQVD